MAQGNQSTYAHPVVGSSNPLPMEDSSSPFYLHNGDHPGLILVSHHLSGSNYNNWSRVMMMGLTTKNKVGFINGCISRPTSDDLLFNAWNRYNNMQGALDINAYYTQFKIIWEELKNFQPLPICHCGGMQAWSDYQ
ncbi:hypothetical protein CK203_015135 [Vitis vinifera]|uniref:Retrotransposon Copia-like N-terminal domain-containing protein n=1 Tax=Vitis vinifera TaxID=29760 RepID=A0A438JCT0_VITVI|nr:hypothetical protein CK203_015135 [Vitis vinifera]